jgi:hypothetical protein
VVVGTTYVDGAVVDGLRHRIDSVENNLDDRKAENDRLDHELGLANGYIDDSADFAVTDRLTDVPVLLVAARGVDEAAVGRTVELVRRADGRTPGILWLEPQWDLEKVDDRAALADIVDGDASASADDLRAAAWAAVMDELATTPEGGATATATDPIPDVLGPLADAGFLTLDALDDPSTSMLDLRGAQPRVTVVTGARAEPGPKAVVPTIADAAVAAQLVTVLADVHVDAPEAAGRGEELLASLSADVVAAAAVVDNADRTEGQVATVLALDAAADGAVGHLGYGNGADGVVPEWTPP